MQYQQVFGCAIGLPVSAMAADLVMANVEERAASASVSSCSTSVVELRYVDNCNVRLMRTDADLLHQHLNSIDGNIQFTTECACQTNKGQSISFLDSRITVLSDGSIATDVNRKSTQTRNTGNTRKLPRWKHSSTGASLFFPPRPVLRTEERECVLNDLKASGYPGSLLRKYPNNKAERPLGFVILLYVKGASDRVGGVVRKSHVRHGSLEASENTGSHI